MQNVQMTLNNCKKKGLDHCRFEQRKVAINVGFYLGKCTRKISLMNLLYISIFAGFQQYV